MIENVRNKNIELLNKYKNELNYDKITLHTLISEMLVNDNLFFEINMEDAINILNDLEYNNTYEIYRKLTTINEFKKNNE